jgi:hypothetical protein
MAFFNSSYIGRGRNIWTLNKIIKRPSKSQETVPLNKKAATVGRRTRIKFLITTGLLLFTLLLSLMYLSEISQLLPSLRGFGVTTFKQCCGAASFLCGSGSDCFHTSKKFWKELKLSILVKTSLEPEPKPELELEPHRFTAPAPTPPKLSGSLQLRLQFRLRNTACKAYDTLYNLNREGLCMANLVAQTLYNPIPGSIISQLPNLS